MLTFERMAIILASWVILAIAFCLALLRAAARPMPPLEADPANQSITPQVSQVFVEQDGEILRRRSAPTVREPAHCTTV